MGALRWSWIRLSWMALTSSIGRNPNIRKRCCKFTTRPSCFTRGNAQILNAPSLRIVGTRKPTMCGSQMAEWPGRDLAVSGIGRHRWRWNLAGRCSAYRAMLLSLLTLRRIGSLSRAQLVTSAEDVTGELPTPVRAALIQAMQPENGQANLLIAASLTPSEKSYTTCSTPMSRNRLMTSLSGPA